MIFLVEQMTQNFFFLCISYECNVMPSLPLLVMSTMMRMVVVEVSRHINQWWAAQAHEIDQAPLFNRLTRPKAPDTELNQGKEKTDAGKIREIGLRFRWKAEKFKMWKNWRGWKSGKLRGNLKLEIIWSCDDGKLARDCILNLGWHTDRRGGVVLVGGTEINEGIQINITFSFSN